MMMANSEKTRKSLPKSLISLSIIGWFSVIGIGVFSLNSIINPQDLNSEKNLLNETIVPEPPPELIISELPEETEKSNLSFFTLILLLLLCAGGSLFVTYILKLLVTSQPQKKPVKTKKIVTKVAKKNPVRPPVSPTITVIQAKKSTHLENSIAEKNPVSPPVSPTITVIPAQESTPVERKNSSLAEMMDLRKRRSLVSIMHDN